MLRLAYLILGIGIGALAMMLWCDLRSNAAGIVATHAQPMVAMHDGVTNA